MLMTAEACSDDGAFDALSEVGSTGSEAGAADDSEPTTAEAVDEAAGLPDDLAEQLTDAWTCGDLLLHVANPERTVMLTVMWPGLRDQAQQAGQRITWEVDFGRPNDRDIALVVHTGTDLDAGTCRRDGDRPAVLEHSFTALEGIARLSVDVTETSSVDASLWDIGLDRGPDQPLITLGDLELPGIALSD